VAQNMQHSMDQKVDEMVLEGLFKLNRFTHQRLIGQRYVTEKTLERIVGIEGGKREDIGGFVHAAPVAVEALLGRIVGQEHRNLAGSVNAIAGIVQRRNQRPFGQFFEPLGPIALFDGYLDREIGAQTSSFPSAAGCLPVEPS